MADHTRESIEKLISMAFTISKRAPFNRTGYHRHADVSHENKTEAVEVEGYETTYKKDGRRRAASLRRATASLDSAAAQKRAVIIRRISSAKT